MKITEKQLRNIIKESIKNVLVEAYASQLMAVLGVKDKEDVIDSLMEQCASVLSPLDFDELLSFLQTNNLSYTRKQ